MPVLDRIPIPDPVQPLGERNDMPEGTVSTIRPTNGRVYLTDRDPYDDASDHNLLAATLSLDATTTARVATFNVRRSDFDKGTPYAWLNRRRRAAKVIADSGASVVALQEMSDNADEYLIAKTAELTGDPWKIVRPSNVAIMYKSDRWTRLTDRRVLMDNGEEMDRRLLVVLLRSIKTGSAFWFGSSHFGVGFELAPFWRRHQAKKCVEQLTNTPRKATETAIPANLFGDIRPITVMMGDFNDYAQHDQTGVRQIFAEAGFYELRVRLSDADMAGDTWRTNHSFGKQTLRDSRQIDAIFTPRGQ
jgi:endonuclease/exonuclease/phosphatase family metal-dependent hydrolase